MKSAYYSRNASYSRSFNAERAEIDGRYPLTRAAGVFASRIGISTAAAKRILKKIGTSEWHHVAKYANRIDYYETYEHTSFSELDAEDFRILYEAVKEETTVKGKVNRRIVCGLLYERVGREEPTFYIGESIQRALANVFLAREMQAAFEERRAWEAKEKKEAQEREDKRLREFFLMQNAVEAVNAENTAKKIFETRRLSYSNLLGFWRNTKRQKLSAAASRIQLKSAEHRRKKIKEIENFLAAKFFNLFLKSGK